MTTARSRADVRLNGAPFDPSHPRGARRRLPFRRSCVTYDLKVGAHEVAVCLGLYPDGTPGEVFLDMAKEGSDLRNFAAGFAISASLLLQYGAPVEAVAHSLEKLSGGPSGDVRGHPTIKRARSMVDLVAQLLRAEHGR